MNHFPFVEWFVHIAGAQTSRDSFAKALYDRLFTWIVGHVNAAIDPALTESSGHRNNTVIGVLDIYGFEVFDKNSFEQVGSQTFEFMPAVLN